MELLGDFKNPFFGAKHSFLKFFYEHIIVDQSKGVRGNLGVYDV